MNRPAAVSSPPPAHCVDDPRGMARLYVLRICSRSSGGSHLPVPQMGVALVVGLVEQLEA